MRTINLYELQMEARNKKLDKHNIGSNNMLKINNRLTGKKVSNFVAAPVAIVQEYDFEAYRVQEITVVEEPVKEVVVIEEQELVIPKFLLPEYKLMKLAAKAYGVSVEAIEMALIDGDLEIYETRTGYKAVLFR